MVRTKGKNTRRNWGTVADAESDGCTGRVTRSLDLGVRRSNPTVGFSYRTDGKWPRRVLDCRLSRSNKTILELWHGSCFCFVGSFRRVVGAANISAIPSKGSELALKRIRTAFVLIPALLASLSVGPASASPIMRPVVDDPVVARVDDIRIRRSDLVVAVQLLPVKYRKLPLDAVYPFVLKQVINNTPIVRAARAEGFEKLASVRQRLKASRGGSSKAPIWRRPRRARLPIRRCVSSTGNLPNRFAGMRSSTCGTFS